MAPSQDDGNALAAAGAALVSAGRFADAERPLRRAVAAQPDLAAAWADLGFALRRLGRPAEAEQAVRDGLARRPDAAALHEVLGTLLLDAGRGDEAVAAVARAADLRPASAAAQFALGVALQRQGRLREAVGPMWRAVELDPASSRYALAAAAFVPWDQSPDAVGRATAAADRVAAAGPTTGRDRLLLATAYLRAGDVDRASHWARLAVAADPASAAAHWHLANLLMLRGDWAEGWPEFEWRLRAMPHLDRRFPQPTWQGEPLAGRTILLHAEGGHGDAIHFARYVPLVAARDGRVVLECHPALVRLFAGIGGVDRVLARGEPLPPFDVHAPLPSLPLAFGTTPQTIPPVPAPATFPAAAPVDRVTRVDGIRRVGICWVGSGRITAEADLRTRTPDVFAPLAAVPGVRLVSLQVGDGRATPPPFPVADPTADVRDFADLAGVVSQLDAVVSVDTGVAHLAASLGKPTSVLVAWPPDFRWGLGRDDSPWYPAMRLFRRRPGEPWAAVFDRVARAFA